MSNRYAKGLSWVALLGVFIFASIFLTKIYKQSKISLFAELTEKRKADAAIPTSLITNEEIIQLKKDIYSAAEEEDKKGCATIDPQTNQPGFCAGSKQRMDNLQNKLVEKVVNLKLK
ncbi:MAG: hypothetical protein JWO40_523 [Candidatus Doudnabacteria bacterium]|nr:hypothetical protein [Candidatus Doudnabacteria bacterium]